MIQSFLLRIQKLLKWMGMMDIVNKFEFHGAKLHSSLINSWILVMTNCELINQWSNLEWWHNWCLHSIGIDKKEIKGKHLPNIEEQYLDDLNIILIVKRHHIPAQEWLKEMRINLSDWNRRDMTIALPGSTDFTKKHNPQC